MDLQNVPGRSWEWSDGAGRSGVHTFEGQLVWWHNPGGPSGHLSEVATTQAFLDFIHRGPPVVVPAPVLRELAELFHALAAPWAARALADEAHVDKAPGAEEQVDQELALALSKLI